MLIFTNDMSFFMSFAIATLKSISIENETKNNYLTGNYGIKIFGTFETLPDSLYFIIKKTFGETDVLNNNK